MSRPFNVPELIALSRVALATTRHGGAMNDKGRETISAALDLLEEVWQEFLHLSHYGPGTCPLCSEYAWNLPGTWRGGECPAAHGDRNAGTPKGGQS